MGRIAAMGEPSGLQLTSSLSKQRLMWAGRTGLFLIEETQQGRVTIAFDAAPRSF